MQAVEGTVDQVIRGEGAWCIVHGDALHVLRDLPDGSVDAFVTDPPYSSRGAFRGDRVKAQARQLGGCVWVNEHYQPHARSRRQPRNDRFAQG